LIPSVVSRWQDVASKYPACARCTKLSTVHGAFARSSVSGIAPLFVCRVTATVPVVGGVVTSGAVTGLAGGPLGVNVQVPAGGAAAVGAAGSSSPPRATVSATTPTTISTATVAAVITATFLRRAASWARRSC
jgi:hypothetical protein